MTRLSHVSSFAAARNRGGKTLAGAVREIAGLGGKAGLATVVEPDKEGLVIAAEAVLAQASPAVRDLAAAAAVLSAALIVVAAPRAALARAVAPAGEAVEVLEAGVEDEAEEVAGAVDKLGFEVSGVRFKLKRSNIECRDPVFGGEK